MNIALPASNSVLGDNLLIWSSIFSSKFYNLVWFADFRFSLNIKPRILIVSYCSLVKMFEAFFYVGCVVYWFIAVPVALLKSLKNFSKFIINSWFWR